ncbi:MAG: hypothetical protein FJ194_14290 [Gammaproteobacteria bacterium]|nr:hypothetical protein [Gammaproteobacteria bacterium]
MTLAFWSDLVKRQQLTAWICFACAAVVLAGFSFIWSSTSPEHARTLAFGQTLADTLAMQGLEYVRGPDTFHLSLLTKRVAELDGVQGAGFYGMDGQSLVESGDMATAADAWREFSMPLAIGPDRVAIARVRLAEEAFSPPMSLRQWIATLSLLLLTPFLAMLLAELNVIRLHRKTLPIIEVEEGPEPEQKPRCLVVGNFHNQFSFSGDVRRTIHERILPKAQEVATLYHGTARTFSAGGLLLEFEGIDDASFQAVCAARLLADVLDLSEPDAEYRFSLHRVMVSPKREVRAELLADAALFATLAPEESLIASHDFMTALEHPERFDVEAVDHPMLDDINTISGPAYCIRAFNGTQAALLERQVDTMLGYSHSTDIASTR